MKCGIRKEIDWKYLGAVLAQSDSNDQVEFLKAFVNECKTWGTCLQIENQFAQINLGLTKQEREILSMITYDEKVGER